MGTLDNGGCFFDREIKSWLSFRATLCRECDGKELVDINANVLSTVFGLKFRQNFRLASLLRFTQCCKKARASSYLIRTSSSIARTLLARTTWTLANVDKLTRTRSLKLTISVIWHALKREIVSSSQSYRMPYTSNRRIQAYESYYQVPESA